MNMDRKELLNFIIESWRFSNLFQQVISKLSEEERKRYTGRHNWYKKKLESTIKSCGYKLINISNEIYDPGMALTPINIDEFTEGEHLIVDYMMEPIIMDENGNIVKTGTAILRRQDT